MLGAVSQVGIAGGGENGVVPEELLHLDQIDTGLDQVRGIAVAQAVRGNLFFKPQWPMTRASARCTPSAFNAVVVLAAACKPRWRSGKSNTGLR